MDCLATLQNGTFEQLATKSTTLLKPDFLCFLSSKYLVPALAQTRDFQGCFFMVLEVFSHSAKLNSWPMHSAPHTSAGAHPEVGGAPALAEPEAPQLRLGGQADSRAEGGALCDPVHCKPRTWGAPLILHPKGPMYYTFLESLWLMGSNGGWFMTFWDH